jgi:hypothetical protein
MESEKVFAFKDKQMIENQLISNFNDMFAKFLLSIQQNAKSSNIFDIKNSEVCCMPNWQNTCISTNNTNPVTFYYMSLSLPRSIYSKKRHESVIENGLSMKELNSCANISEKKTYQTISDINYFPRSVNQNTMLINDARKKFNIVSHGKSGWTCLTCRNFNYRSIFLI